jgi:2-polyprenyl-6-methoxyphenol hydroxylase-like FAD-dependent oxidoreductase
MLSHLLHLQGIESVVLELRAREEVETTVRAGVLEDATAELLRETGAGDVVPPDDVDAIAAALSALVGRWRDDSLDGVALAPETRAALSRRARVERFAELLRSLP